MILGIWGIETSFGEDKDRWDVIRSLATLAQARFRHPYFRDELIVALRIVQDGHIARDKMLGSWAGAMGQPQFMPSNFFDYAVDFSANGRRDIWNDVPDVLASIANYLRKEGWNNDLTWGFEVIIPQDFDYRRSRGSFADWAQLGLRRPTGQELPALGDAILFFPSGAAGPAFLVTDNFAVVRRYNDSDLYALAVLPLADRIRGLAPVKAAWPLDDRQLSRDQRLALQAKLAELGYAIRDFEGHFDFDLRDAVRELQLKYGIRPDGHPTPSLLERLGIRQSRTRGAAWALGYGLEMHQTNTDHIRRPAQTSSRVAGGRPHAFRKFPYRNNNLQNWLRMPGRLWGRRSFQAKSPFRTKFRQIGEPLLPGLEPGELGVREHSEP